MCVHLCCRQSRGHDEAVQIWGKLYWVNDSATSLNHNWHIHTTAVSREGGWAGGSGEVGRVSEQSVGT